MIQDHTQYLLNKDHQHHRWQPQKSWMSWSRLPGCAGQAADAVSAYTRSKWKMHRRYWKFQSQNVQTFGYVYQTQMAKIMVQYGRSSRSSWTKSVRSSFGRTVMGKAIWENPIEVRLGEKFQIGNVSFVTTRKRAILICVCGRYQTGWKETNIESDVESTQWKTVILGEPTSFLDHVYLGCTQRECQISKDFVDNYRNMFESRLSAGAVEKTTRNQSSRETWCEHYFFMVLWYGRSCKEVGGKILWAGEQNNSTITQSRNAMHGRPPI